MSSPLIRPHYFAGMVPGLDDLAREQQYLLQRLRRHNRWAHGWGVLHGLAVSVAGDELLVSPGLAIDCEGNELALPMAHRLSLAAAADPLLFVGLLFTETFASPVPWPEPLPGVPVGDGVGFTTVIEGAELLISTSHPGAGHARQGPGTPGCGQRHAVPLARLRRHGAQWQVRQTGRRGR